MLSLATKPAQNEKQGSGRFSTLRRRKRQKKGAQTPKEFSYLKDNTDLTMRFNTARDPIYFVFEHLDKKPLPQLMNEFIKDSFFSVAKFISQVAG